MPLESVGIDERIILKWTLKNKIGVLVDWYGSD